MGFWTVLPSYIQAGAVVTATVFAVCGVTAWRRESLGKRRAEIAEQALVASSRVKSAFSHIRGAAVYGTEGKTREPDDDEEPELSEKLNSYFVPLERLNECRDDFAQLQAAKLLCKAHFGLIAENPFDELFKIRTEIIVAAQMRMMLASDRHHYGDEPDKALTQKFHETIWYRGETDKIQERIDDAISQIETICTPHLRP